MNWLTEFVRPKIRAFVGAKKSVPDNLWDKCSKCDQMIFHRDYVKNMYVCHHCGNHKRLNVSQRLEVLYGKGAYEEEPLEKVIKDPLKFKDSKKYEDRLKDYRKKTNRDDAIAVAHGMIGKHRVVTAIFDFNFMGGSMGMAVGKGIVKAARVAKNMKAPLIIVPASGGARMQEGILSLMQMPVSIAAINMVKEAGLPYINLLTDPTTGGVAASFAMLGDITVAEPEALIGFAGRRVIEETHGEKLPENFQRAEYLLEKGMVDMIVERKDLREKLACLIDLIMRPKK